jgi:hypothetical protein
MTWSQFAAHVPSLVADDVDIARGVLAAVSLLLPPLAV